MYKETRKTTKCIDFKTQKYGLSRGGARGCQGGNCPPKILPGPPSAPPKLGLFLKVLHRPLTVPLVAKLAVALQWPPQMKMSGSAHGSKYDNSVTF